MGGLLVVDDDLNLISDGGQADRLVCCTLGHAEVAQVVQIHPSMA